MAHNKINNNKPGNHPDESRLGYFNAPKPNVSDSIKT